MDEPRTKQQIDADVERIHKDVIYPFMQEFASGTGFATVNARRDKDVFVSELSLFADKYRIEVRVSPGGLRHTSLWSRRYEYARRFPTSGDVEAYKSYPSRKSVEAGNGDIDAAREWIENESAGWREVIDQELREGSGA